MLRVDGTQIGGSGLIFLFCVYIGSTATYRLLEPCISFTGTYPFTVYYPLLISHSLGYDIRILLPSPSLYFFPLSRSVFRG
jgi:hypothetical protein